MLDYSLEGWQNGNALVSKTSGRKPLQVRALYPPPLVYIGFTTGYNFGMEPKGFFGEAPENFEQ